MTSIIRTVELWLTLYLIINVRINHCLRSPSPRKNLNFTEMAKFDGYKTESHQVTTSDGYILGLFRVPLQKNCKADPKRDPIIFMHGLYLSGDDCLLPGPGKAHCYIYADNCYDVWVPNVRGNVYSRHHIKYNPDTDSQFWDYDVDEIALYDLPAVLDYVLEITSRKQVAYVGHAQGATMLFLLCAKKPEYNAKIKVGFGLSTTAWLNHSRFIIIGLETALSPLLTAAQNLGVNAELLTRGGISNTVIESFCGSTKLMYPVCSVIIFAVLGYNKFQITDDVLIDVSGHVPSGTSLKNINRWGQMKFGFKEFNYGPLKNLVKYGQITPPIIDLSQVTMRWVFIASHNDYVSDIKDMNTFISNLPNAETSMCILSDKTFGHLDFIYGKDIPKYITGSILKYLKDDELVCM